MTDYSFEVLKKKSVDELREIAKGLDHPAVQGYSQLNKEHLLPAVCTALGLDAREHHVAAGIDKSALKTRIRTLKAERDKALGAHDAKRIKRLRRQIHRLKHELRAAAH